jgi:hypothetical protein
VINLQTNPLNTIETTLGTLCGSQAFFVKTVAQKIRNGLVQEGFSVVETAQVDRLHSLVLSIYNDQDNDSLKEALGLLEGWK